MNKGRLSEFIAKPIEDNKKEITLEEHNQGLHDILDQLKGIYNLSDEIYQSLKKSIDYHDIGKVTDDWQNNPKSLYKRIRHEVLSASCKDLTDYQRLTILLHHKDFETLNRRLDEDNFENFYLSDLEDMKKKLNIAEIINITKVLERFTGEIHRSNTESEFSYRPKDEDISLLKNKRMILEKGFLQYCDHLASAKIKELKKGYFATKIYNFDNETPIQKKAKDNKSHSTMIIGHTGCGKTEAGLYFADSVQNQDNSRRIFYILPYRTSINAMHKRLNKQNEVASLLHGQAKYFLLKELDDIEEVKHKYQIFRKSVNQITVCTIFQLIKAFFNCRYSEMLISQMSNSIFIIDELHCFDIKSLMYTIETLRYLQENYGASICIMSASIHTKLKELVVERLNISNMIEYDYKEKDKNLELKRHRLHKKDKRIDDSVIGEIIKRYNSTDDKIIICVNTIQKAQDIYRKLEDRISKEDRILIHGLYNAEDRYEIENIITGDKPPRILVGTQAIEVSLNIDYDVLYTEICPFDALIQRCGRVNRNRKYSWVADIYVFQEDLLSAYDISHLDRTMEVIDRIINQSDGIILESCISEYLDQIYFDFNISEYMKEQRKYQRVMNKYKIGYIQKNMDDLEQLFDSMPVLPEQLVNRYIEYIDNKDYLNAGGLIITMSQGKYYKAKAEGVIYQKKGIDVINKIYYSGKERGRGLDLNESSSYNSNLC